MHTHAQCILEISLYLIAFHIEQKSLREGTNTTIFSTAMDKSYGRLGSLALVMVGYLNENSEVKPVELHLKNGLVPHPTSVD